MHVLEKFLEDLGPSRNRTATVGLLKIPKDAHDSESEVLEEVILISLESH